MRILTRTVATLTACLLLLAGCDNLNLEPRDEISSDAVWSDPALARAYLNEVYSSTGLGYGDPMPTPGVVDESVNTHGHGGDAVQTSTLTPDNRGIWDSPGWRPASNPPYEQYNWSSVYSTIRDLNLFITNVEGNEAMPAGERETLLGEASFLRAYFYHNLVKLYGGVPLLDEPAELGEDIGQYQVPRNTFEESINFIVSDLDRASDQLSLDARRAGAATQGAAMALKCRVLLYAASDLHNGNPLGHPSDKAPLTGYTGGSQMQRWTDARDACQAVIDLNEYSLEQTPTADEYQSLLVEGAGDGMIWARFFSEDGGDAHNHSQFVSPNGYNSWTGDAPAQNHVDAYEMADGSEFSWDNPQHAEAPYTNRDLRLYANIQFNGKEWRERPEGVTSLDPRGVIQTGWYEDPENGGSMDPGIQGDMRPGLDTREGPIQQWNGTKTGYNLSKFVDSNISPDTEQSYNPWVHIRYAEVLLNYAEAEAELGNIPDARSTLNQVRARVGMPDVPADGGPGRTFMERIRQERQVELAFEGHRYFDVRRWMIGPDAYEDGKGIRVTGELDPNGELLVDNRYDYEFEVITIQDRAWDDKNYFLPISRGERNRNPNLVQNPGYN